MSEIFGEARIAVVPDTTAFRAALITQIETAKRGVVASIPVNLVGAQQATQQQQQLTRATQGAAAAATASAGAAQKEAAALRETGVAASQVRAQQSALVRVQEGRAAIAQRLALADVKASLTTSALASARARLTQIDAAATAAERTHEAAIISKDAALVRSSEIQLRDVIAKQEGARAAVRAAIAEEELASATQHRTASQSFAARGAAGGVLNLLGLRGAMLAANASFLAGAAGFIAFSKAVGVAADLEQQLNVFRVTARATADEMEQVREQSRALGADLTLPGVSAGDAAVAMATLAKAGLSVQDSLKGARGVLQLATAAQIDNAQATEIVASALNSFGLEGDQAVRVADNLANASIEAQGSITDMGFALTSAASVSRQVGIGLEDTVALISLLAKNGIQGAAGGTVLRVALLRLINPSKEAADIIERLGLRIRDAQGNVRPEVFADFAAATRELSRAQQDAFAAEVFGVRGIRAQAILGREGADALHEMRVAVERAGAAQELAAAQTAGFSGKVEALKNTAAATGLSIGQVLIPALGILFEGINKDIQAVNFLISKLQALGNIDLRPGGGEGGFFDFVGQGREAGGFLDRITAGIPVIHSFFDPISGQSQEAQNAVARLSDSLDALHGNVVPLASDIQAAFTSGGTEGAVRFARHLQDQIKDTTPQAQELHSALEAIIRSLTALDRAPTDIELRALLDTGSISDELIKAQGRISSAPPLEIKAGFAKDSLVFLEHSADVAAQRSATNAGHQFGIFFGNAITDPTLLAQLSGANLFAPLVDAAKVAGGDAAAAFTSTFDTQVDVLEATGGSDAQILSVLNEQLIRRQRLLTRAQAKFKARPTRENDAFVGRAANLVTETQEKIERITDQQVADAKSVAAETKKRADDIVEARNEADAAALKAFDVRQGRPEAELIAAASTETLQDDIKANVHLRRVLRKQINAAKTQIKDLEVQRDFIRTTQKRILQITTDIVRSKKAFADELAQQAQDARDRAQETRDFAQRHLESILSIAQTTEGAADDRRALTALAAFDQRQIARLLAIKKTRKLTREEQEQLDGYRVDLAQRNQALRELGEEAKKGNATAQATFEFLQAQQGFAANLLGNLVPLGGLSGTVGGGPAVPPQAAPPLQDAIRQQAAVKAARDQGGFTGSQSSTVVELLRLMVTELRAIRGGNAHPEASYHRKAARGGAGVNVQ